MDVSGKAWTEGRNSPHRAASAWVNVLVLLLLLAVAAVMMMMLVVPADRWEVAWDALPERLAQLQELLRGRRPGGGELAPVSSPTPPAGGGD
jgi:flagellar basal body-associated protein FliL